MSIIYELVAVTLDVLCSFEY